MCEGKTVTWIDRRIADLEAWRTRNTAVRESALEIYEALWTEIVGHVQDAQARGIDASTNGAPRKRVVRLPKENKSGQYFELQVILADSKDRIRATGARLKPVDLTFHLDICPDGVVCLKLNEERVSIEDAAIAILDPFLFPQLQREQA